MSSFLLGADPELFVFKDGLPVGALGLIPGDKESPYPVPLGAVQVDGMAAEFNIDPASDEASFVHNIKTVMEGLSNMLEGYELKALPTVVFGRELLDMQPVESRELGCNPDFDAYSFGLSNPKPNEDVDFRTGSGHIHLGYKLEGEDLFDMVFQLDFYLGLSSLMWDDDTKRRELYGKAGCYRPKPYGVEYRTLSNAWLKSEHTISLVYRLAKRAVEDFSNGMKPPLECLEEVRDIINNSDKERAIELLKKHGVTEAL